MKKYLYTLAALSLLAMSCSSDDDDEEQTVTKSLVGTWSVDSMRQSSLSGIYTTTYYPDGNLQLTFGADGSFSASGTTSTYNKNSWSNKVYHGEGDYLIEDFPKYNAWRTYNDGKDNTINFSGASVYDAKYGVEIGETSGTAVLWKNHTYPMIYIHKVK